MLPKPLGVGARCCKPSSRRTCNVRGSAGRLGHEGTRGWVHGDRARCPLLRSWPPHVANPWELLNNQFSREG